MGSEKEREEKTEVGKKLEDFGGKMRMVKRKRNE